ncbi:hypothetical protein BKA61DRAFT_581473 [Leptodontidium sp. MPI-SDFR-AT-0119]|nr:hypothetical protein BKA61DRAFT_581473 [Leptodontidium sp. MPI-SDFR-AT-0119]
MSDILFSPFKIGSVELKHRIVMAPMTRYRADESHVPVEMMIDYYAQRASMPGTLIISEGTFISPEAGGNACVPGIWNEAQIKAWKKVTDAVHAKKSFIFCQLWALGRAAKAKPIEKEGIRMVSSSNLPLSSDAPVPHPLNETEIHSFIQQYATAAKNAVAAGFDGVEIHGANGYLVDQFLQDKCNNREDAWGGSIEKRARFGIEVASAIAAAVGPERVGYRVSPFSHFQGMRMDDPVPQFTYLAKELSKLNLAYLHAVESRIAGSQDVDSDSPEKVDFLIDAWGSSGAVIVAGGFTPESAAEAVKQRPGKNIAVGFGRYFTSNPDLPYRIHEKIPLVEYNRATFYVEQSPIGYVDYPFSPAFKEVTLKA